MLSKFELINLIQLYKMPRSVRRTWLSKTGHRYSCLKPLYWCVNQSYRCLDCLEGAVTRSFNTSHLKTQCSRCGSFSRFINEAVLDQFQSFEESPPDTLQWSQLDRKEKLVISEQIVRRGRSIDDFAVST